MSSRNSVQPALNTDYTFPFSGKYDEKKIDIRDGLILSRQPVFIQILSKGAYFLPERNTVILEKWRKLAPVILPGFLQL